MEKEKSTTFNGWLGDFWEQGIERMPYLIFQDKRFCTNRTDGWKREGMHILNSSDKLTIYDDEDNLLWQGVIKAKKVGFLGLKTLYPTDFEWCPEDVDYELWRSWFKIKPPLRAVLTPNGGKLNNYY